MTGTDEPDSVVAARIEVERAKSQLMDTARDLQSRLNPKTLARDAWDNAKVKGADLAEDAVDAVRKRPVAAGGVVAAIALFLARQPIKDLAERLMTRSDEDETMENDETESVE